MSELENIRDWPTKHFDFSLPIRYHLTEKKGDGVVICLHGYQDHALSMLRRIGWWHVEPPFQVLGINGPFPVPLWTKLGFIEAYSWYFRDSATHIMLAHPMATASVLQRFVSEAGLLETPKVLFGFSQGGFLAPYLASKLENVRGIIGLGCGYSDEAFSVCPPLEVHALHGDQDERVALDNSRRDFEKIKQYGHHGTFHEIPGLTHRVEESVEPLVRTLTQQMLKCGKTEP